MKGVPFVNSRYTKGALISWKMSKRVRGLDPWAKPPHLRIVESIHLPHPPFPPGMRLIKLKQFFLQKALLSFSIAIRQVSLPPLVNTWYLPVLSKDLQHPRLFGWRMVWKSLIIRPRPIREEKAQSQSCTFLNVQEHHAGNYTCKAANAMGSGVSRNALLSLTGKPDSAKSKLY